MVRGKAEGNPLSPLVKFGTESNIKMCHLGLLQSNRLFFFIIPKVEVNS